MYKIWNYLFEWDYIAWVNSAGAGIARVHTDGNGITPFSFRRTTIHHQSQ